MRWRTSRAVAAFTCHIGERISSTSIVLTSDTGRLPMRGNAYRSMLRHQCRACHRPREPPGGRFLSAHAATWSHTDLLRRDDDLRRLGPEGGTGGV